MIFHFKRIQAIGQREHRQKKSSELNRDRDNKIKMVKLCTRDLDSTRVGVSRKVSSKATGVIENGEFVKVNDKMSQIEGIGGQRWEGELQGNALIG